ncbi:hypothetical protein [Paraburkholderia sp. SIMBA_054]|uniref:hypothetical protein n=1 Tax=Paraburkholderia sp. SIMBA_054 TaxID=3085795 RepID=UPI00397E5ADA
MTFKVTQIGGDAPKDPPDDADRERNRVSRFPVTALPSSVSALPSPVQSIAPTVVPQTLPKVSAASDDVTTNAARTPMQNRHIPPSVVPGVKKHLYSVSIAELQQKTPGATVDLLTRVKGVLTGLSPEDTPAVTWLRFGVPEQESANAILRKSLDAAEDPVPAEAIALVRRLHTILSEVAAAIEGGFLRRPASVVWANHEPEIWQIEARLTTNLPALTEIALQPATLKHRFEAAYVELEVSFLAGEFVIEKLDSESASVLQSRLTALTASQAMIQENILALTQHTARLKELVLLVQDGVLVKLPAMYGLFASLAEKPNETERFLALQKLSDLTQIIERKKL